MYSVLLTFAMSGADLQVDYTPRRFRVSAGCGGAQAQSYAAPSASAGCHGSVRAFSVEPAAAGCAGSYAAGIGLFGVRERRSSRIEARASARAARHTPATAYYAPSAVYVAAPVASIQTAPPPAAPRAVPPATPPAAFKAQSAPACVIVQRPIVLRRPVVAFSGFSSNCPKGNCPTAGRWR